MERVQDTHQGFFGDCGRAEGHQVLPFQAKAHGQRLDQDPEPAEVAALRIASETVGQHKEHDGAYRDDAEPAERCPGCAAGSIQGVPEGGPVIGGSSMMSLTCSFFVARVAPNARRLSISTYTGRLITSPESLLYCQRVRWQWEEAPKGRLRRTRTSSLQ